MKKSLFIIVLCFCFIIFAGLSFPSCSKNKTTSDSTSTPTAILPSEPLSTVDALSLDATITANYQAAETMAKKWKADATLYMDSVKLPQDLSLNGATQTFTYGSPSDTANWWTYSYSEATGKYVRALIPKEDYLGDVTTAIDKRYWRTNYVEAFQIAEANGGTAFREANPNTNIILTLSQSQPKGWLWWVVDYKTTDGNNLKVRINPNDKTVVDESGNIVANGNTYNSSTATSTSTTTTYPTSTTTTTY